MNRKQLNKLWSVLPKTLCTSCFLVTRDECRWQQGGSLRGPVQLLWRWYERKGNYAFFFFQFCKVEWRPLLPLLCFQPRISETENLRQHQVITIQRIYFFIKHMHMLLCRVGFLRVHGQRRVSVDRETPNSLHTSTLELRLLRRWPRFECVTLLTGSFLVALDLVGIFFFFLMYA